MEQAINGVEGMIYMKSTSSDDGSVNIDVTFDLGTDADLAAVRVQNNVNIAEARLPEAVRRQGIEVIKRSPSLLVVLSLVGDVDEATGEPIYDYAFLSNYATLRVLDPDCGTPGVGEAGLFGARDYSMRIWLDPQKMRARDLTTVDVLAELRAQNVQLAAGRLGDQPTGDESGFTYTLTSEGRLTDPVEFENIIVKTGENQRVVRVKDVGRVELGSELYGSTARRNGPARAQVPVYQLPGSNSVQTSAAVKEVMEGLAADFPPGLRYEVDLRLHQVRRGFHRGGRLHAVARLGTGCARRLRLPAGLAGHTGARGHDPGVAGRHARGALRLRLLAQPAHALRPRARDRHRRRRRDRRRGELRRKIEETGCCAADAATEAMREITGPIVATTLVVLAVFVPAALLPGLTGQLYRQFAVTLSVATVFSSINALTLSPALLRSPAQAEQGVA